MSRSDPEPIRPPASCCVQISRYYFFTKVPATIIRYKTCFVHLILSPYPPKFGQKPVGVPSKVTVCKIFNTWLFLAEKITRVTQKYWAYLIGFFLNMVFCVTTVLKHGNYGNLILQLNVVLHFKTRYFNVSLQRYNSRFLRLKDSKQGCFGGVGFQTCSHLSSSLIQWHLTSQQQHLKLMSVVLTVCSLVNNINTHPQKHTSCRISCFSKGRI